MSIISHLTQFARATPSPSFTLPIVNGSTHFGRGYAVETNSVRQRVTITPDGTKVDYDGTADAPIVLGTIAQNVLVKAGSGVDTTFDTMVSRLAKYATLTAVTKSGSTVTCSARLITVDDSDTPFTWNADTRRRVLLVFELLTEWA